jgi:uncharacterized protein YegL
VAANGRKYVSFGIQGTGVYYFKYFDWGRAGHVPRSTGQSVNTSTTGASSSTALARCVLIVDSSASVAGSPIERLNDALTSLSVHLRSFAPTPCQVELALFTFGDDERQSDFTPMETFNPPRLTASGRPNAGRVIGRALERASENAGAARARTLVFLVTNSSLPGSLSDLSIRVEAGERHREFAFFAVGLDDADLRQLARVAMRRPLRLSEGKIDEFFAWASRTLVGLGRTRPGEEMLLEPPLWAR